VFTLRVPPTNAWAALAALVRLFLRHCFGFCTPVPVKLPLPRVASVNVPSWPATGSAKTLPSVTVPQPQTAMPGPGSAQARQPAASVEQVVTPPEALQNLPAPVHSVGDALHLHEAEVEVSAEQVWLDAQAVGGPNLLAMQPPMVIGTQFCRPPVTGSHLLSP